MTRSVAAAVTLGLAVLGADAASAQPAPLRLERIALGELGGWIALEVAVDGHAGRWLLDTGASRNLVSPEFVRRHGLARGSSVVADTPLGQVRGREVELPPLLIGGVERRRQRALEVELGRLFGPAAEGVDGVIGVPMLDGVQLDLDLRGWSAALRESRAAECPEGLAAVALGRHRTLPVITLDVAGASEGYVLDTGNPSGLIRVEADAPTAATAGLALPADMRLTVLGEAALGPQTRSDVPVLRLVSAALKRAFDGVVRGLAGTAFIDGARWRLDLGREQLCVESGRFATAGGFGLTLERRAGALAIGLVLPGSPAERAGLRPGETVTRWASLPPSRPLAELWGAVQGADEVTLSVEPPAREVTLRRAIFAPPAAP
jgi:hypothetical protein